MINVGTRTVVAKSCVLCGVLKMANQFAVVQKKYRDSYCRTCHNRHGRPVMRGHQETASKAASKHREPWTDSDISRLRELIEDGLTGPQIALALKRTVYSVYTMKNKISRGDL